MKSSIQAKESKKGWFTSDLCNWEAILQWSGPNTLHSYSRYQWHNMVAQQLYVTNSVGPIEWNAILVELWPNCDKHVKNVTLGSPGALYNEESTLRLNISIIFICIQCLTWWNYKFNHHFSKVYFWWSMLRKIVS